MKLCRLNAKFYEFDDESVFAPFPVVESYSVFTQVPDLSTDQRYLHFNVHFIRLHTSAPLHFRENIEITCSPPHLYDSYNYWLLCRL